MRTLEEIADNPRKATISENLVLVADPLNDYKKSRGNLSQEKIDEIREALKEHFIFGESLISIFRSELVELEPNTDFNNFKVSNAYDMLKVLIEKKPKPLDDKLAYLWKHSNSIKSGRITMSEKESVFLKLVPYTHQYRHFVTKKNGRDNPFSPLKNVPEDGLSIYIRENKNKGYPNFPLYAWIERVKSRERTVNKLLEKIFDAMKKSSHGDDFYSQYFGNDQFGIRTIGFTPYTRKRVESIIYPFNKQGNWIVDQFEDFEKTQRKKIRVQQYMIRWSKEPDVPVPLQLQVANYAKMLLDDFFDRDSHPRYEVRREDKLDGYKKQHKEQYRRMEKSVNEVLSFLSR